MLYQAGENLLHLLRLAVQGFPVGGVLLCGLGRVDGDDLETGRLVLAVIQEGSVGADGSETGGRIIVGEHGVALAGHPVGGGIAGVAVRDDRLPGCADLLDSLD